MSDPEPIDLSQLQNLNLAPDWVGDLQKREAAPGEVVWGRAPDNEREARGGGQGQGYGGGGGGNRGPRRDGGGFGARGDFNRPGGPPRGPRPDGPRGPRQDDRGPRPGGPGGPGGFGGPRQDGPRGPGPRPDGPPRGDGPRGPRPDGPSRGDGPRGPRPDDRGPRPGGPPGDRGPRPGGPRDDRGPRPGGRPDFRNDRGRGPGRFDDRPYIEPLPGWRARLFAEPRSLEAITRQVKASGRAYPVFELGRLFLAGRDRYVVEFSRQPQPQAPRNAPKGTPAPTPEPLPGPEQIYHIPSDGSLWLNRDEAIRHLINGPSLRKFYRKETISVDPPKGIFTAVAVCGFSGEILGPPNHHSFQTTVAKLHREQFYNLPIDRYKARIRTEKSEELVAKWMEQQSTTTVYIPLSAEEMAANAAAEAAAKAAAEAKSKETAATPAAAPAAESESPNAEAPAEATPGETPEPGADSTEASEAPATESSETAAPDSTPAAEETAAPEATAEPSADATEESAAEASEESAGSAPAIEAAPPVEPLKNWAAVEAHFLAHHADKAVKAVSRIKVPGNIPGKLLAPSLLALLRMEVEQQQRFPMQLVQDLCRDLEKESLKFFKRDKKATFVCRTRPHFIDDESHLSPRLRSIVGVVRANPGITVGKLVSTLAPHIEKPATRSEIAKAPAPEKPAAEAPAAEAKAPEAPAVAETAAPATSEAPAEATPEAAAEAPTTDAAPVESPASEAPATETPEATADTTEAPVDSTAAETSASAETASTESPAAAPDAAAPTSEKPAREPRERGPKNRNKKQPPAPEAPPAPLTAEEIGVLQDLRWLVQEGFVTEFATGELQLLGRPPQPPAEKKVKGDNKTESASAAASTTETEAPASDAAIIDALTSEAPTESETAAGAEAQAESAAEAPASPETEAAPTPESPAGEPTEDSKSPEA